MWDVRRYGKKDFTKCQVHNDSVYRSPWTYGFSLWFLLWEVFRVGMQFIPSRYSVDKLVCSV